MHHSLGLILQSELATLLSSRHASESQQCCFLAASEADSSNIKQQGLSFTDNLSVALPLSEHDATRLSSNAGRLLGSNVWVLRAKRPLFGKWKSTFPTLRDRILKLVSQKLCPLEELPALDDGEIVLFGTGSR